MSVLLSVSSVLSLLTFLTTVLALVKVGTAAFASNQPFRQSPPNLGMRPPLRIQWEGGETGMSLSRAMRFGMKQEKERANGEGGLEEGGYLGGAPLVRMPTTTIQPPARVHSRPPSPYPVPVPMSMAKLILQRQLKRKPGRIPVRRPPGLPSNTTPPSRSRLIEQVL